MRREAIVFPSLGEVVVEEIDLSEMGSRDVLIDIEYSSISRELSIGASTERDPNGR